MPFDRRGNWSGRPDTLNGVLGRMDDSYLSAVAGARGGVVDLPGASMTQILSGGRPEDIVQIPDCLVEVTVSALRKILLDQYGHTPETYSALPDAEQQRLARKMVQTVRRVRMPDSETARLRAERGELHAWLRGWAEGPLTLEHPQGSSYHHLLDYDDRSSAQIGAEGKSIREIDAEFGDPQIFVVERDWARAFAGYDLAKGESPLPFPACCFEFRISGVRVLAMHRETEGMVYMFCVYGRDGVWVADDYGYWIGDGTFRAQRASENSDAREFPRVARLVHDNVRVACIMVDAEVATREKRVASSALVRKRNAERRPAPRDHYVVDLKKTYKASSRAATTGTGGHRTPQRGHFRRGTWVHYDDPDSGEAQYADAGGFWHSRTWRRWHFAGDPNNLITKEYRL